MNCSIGVSKFNDFMSVFIAVQYCYVLQVRWWWNCIIRNILQFVKILIFSYHRYTQFYFDHSFPIWSNYTITSSPLKRKTQYNCKDKSTKLTQSPNSNFSYTSQRRASLNKKKHKTKEGWKQIKKWFNFLIIKFENRKRRITRRYRDFQLVILSLLVEFHWKAI